MKEPRKKLGRREAGMVLSMGGREEEDVSGDKMYHEREREREREKERKRD